MLSTVSKSSGQLLLLTLLFLSLSLDGSVEDKSRGRLVNDNNKKPHCKMRTTDAGGMPHLCLFAIKDIVPGEEITHSYRDADWPWCKQVHDHQG